jgi:large subunit ribosomal protein L21
MNSYIVIEIGGLQYKVSEGQEFYLPHIDGEVGKSILVEKVLLISENGKISLGTPYLNSLKPRLVITAQEKGPKLKISKYKAKSRYQKEIGFRSKLTKVRLHFSH